jgi:hypothetical protein
MENLIPDGSRNYNIEIKEEMKILQETREEFTDTISATRKKIWKMLKMINKNHNKRILN